MATTKPIGAAASEELLSTVATPFLPTERKRDACSENGENNEGETRVAPVTDLPEGGRHGDDGGYRHNHEPDDGQVAETKGRPASPSGVGESIILVPATGGRRRVAEATHQGRAGSARR